MSTPELPIHAFNFMATPAAPDLKLTPFKAEDQVIGYLSALSNAVSNEQFDPNGSVHATVFGEWGHGKTQVLYRTAAYLRQEQPHVISITIIPEVMTAIELLRMARDSAGNQLLNGLDILDEAITIVGEHREDSTEAMEIAARAIAELAARSDRLHTALLFDEVQTMERLSFQSFLQELNRSFKDRHLSLHTMQCHSLATLDDTREIAYELGDWLMQAYVIHLPAIEIADAHSFFKQRIADCGGEEAVQDLVPEGIARTLCMSAGGNPRKMLTLAQEIYQHLREQGGDRFSGDLVVATLSSQPGPKPGSRLLMFDRLKRVLNLLPQMLSEEDGKLVATFLKDHFTELYAERKRYSVTDLVNILQVDAGFLQLLQRSVDDDIPIFVSEEDEILEITQYRLSDELRRYLSENFGSTGGLDLKDLQYGMVLNPTRYQVEVTDGLAHVLRKYGFAVEPPNMESLGKFQNGAPIRGYRMRSMIEQVPLYASVLVTCVFGIEPPQEMILKIVQGLRDRTWLRVFLFFNHPDYSWEQWRELPNAQEWFDGHAEEGAQPRIAALTSSEWGDLVRPIQMEDDLDFHPSVQSVRFFATIAGVGKVIATQEKLDEGYRSICSQIAKFVTNKHLQLSEVCYLPSDGERDLLNKPFWSEDRFKKGVNLSQIKRETNQPWTTKQLSIPEGEYLKRSGRLIRRADISNTHIYKGVLGVLKKSKDRRLYIDKLSEEVSKCILVAEHGDRLRSCIEWILNQMKEDGHADSDLIEAWYVDIDRENRENERQVKRALKETKKVLKQITSFQPSLAIKIEERYRVIRDEHEKLSRTPRERQQTLEKSVQNLTLLKQEIEQILNRIESHKSTARDFVDELLEKLKKDRAEITPIWQELILPEQLLTDAIKKVEEFFELIENSQQPISKSELRSRQKILQGQFEWLSKKVKGLIDSEDPREILCNLVASKKNFSRVIVTVEEENNAHHWS